MASQRIKQPKKRETLIENANQIILSRELVTLKKNAPLPLSFRQLERKNLDAVILLNPQNEEAIYNLAKLNLDESDYKESKKLIDKLLVFCKDYCQKSKKLKIEIENSIKK